MEFNLMMLDVELAKKISKERIEVNKILPYRELENKVIILSSDNKVVNNQELEFIFGKKVIFETVSEVRLVNAVGLICFEDSDEIEELVIRDAVTENASDIHFEPTEKSVVVRVRIDGKLQIRKLLSKKQYNKLLSKIKIQSKLDITEKRRPQDGKISYRLNDINYDLRVSLIRTYYEEKLVLRILYGETFNHSINNLNFNDLQLEKLNKIMNVANGLTIITGPTGSGKSTTLYSMLQNINNETINITTLEDPIEVVISGINQISLDKKVDLDFATGLRSVLRQDPDVLMIGEVRDEQTAAMAVRAAITGHKVYSTLHTRDPREVFLRLEDMGVKKYLLRDSIVGIISQRLVETLCINCKQEDGIKEFKGIKYMSYIKSCCQKCGYTGYKGRRVVAAIHHISKSDKKLLNNIYDDDTLLTNDEMEMNLRELLYKGFISFEYYKWFLEVEEIANEDSSVSEKEG